MRQLVALFAVFGLIALIASYVALAPLATSAPVALYGTAAVLDRGAARISEIGGRSTAVLALLGGGAVLGMIAAMLAADRRAKNGSDDPVPAPGPVWRPQPLEPEYRISNLGRPAYPVVLARKMRQRGGDWPDGASWLGGLPRLANAEWPRDSGGTPLPFAAQVDLAELAAACPQSPLPHEGSLAFFLGAGAVVAVPTGDHEFTRPPTDLPPAYEEGGAPLPAQRTRLSQPLFPFWPVEPVALSEGQPDGGDVSQMVRQRFGEPGTTPPTADDGALWWYGVFHLADQLREAVERTERISAPDIPEPGNEPDAALPAMAAAMDGFIADRDPWEPLTIEERDLVVEILDEMRRHDLLGQGSTAHSLASLQALCIRTMISGPPEAFAALPRDVLMRIAGKHRVPPARQHQITPISEHGEDLLLLQLGYDDMMEWRWKDQGVFRFRISPRDAAAGKWERARLSFESD